MSDINLICAHIIGNLDHAEVTPINPGVMLRYLKTVYKGGKIGKKGKSLMFSFLHPFRFLPP